MALPLLESLPLFRRAARSGDIPEAFRRSVHGQRCQRGSLGRRKDRART